MKEYKEVKIDLNDLERVKKEYLAKGFEIIEEKEKYDGSTLKSKVISLRKINNEQYGEMLKKPCFEDVIFEDNVQEAMKLVIENAKKTPLNILLWGSAGVGKTLTAKMLSVELNRPFVYLNGQMSVVKISEILTKLKDNCLVLFDEIHNIPDKVAEVIYPAIQDGEFGVNGEIIRLKNIMFVGTTTEPQMLPKPLKDRFKQIELEELSKEKLSLLLNSLGCDTKVADYILNYTQNIRIINNLLETMLLYGDYSEENLIKVFRLKRINLYSGLSSLQDKYLSILKKQNKPLSLRALCLLLQKSEDYLKLEVEGELIKKELIIVTSRGREINPQMRESLNELAKAKEPTTIDSRQIAIDYLNENKHIKEKFGKRYLELVNWLSEKIDDGISPDLIDIYSFGNDVDIQESYKNNYLEDL